MPARKKVEPVVEEIQPANVIIIAEGTDHEYVKRLAVPKGRQARKTMPKLLNFMAALSDKGDVFDAANENLGGMVDLIETIWDYDNFEEELVPFALQMTSAEEQQLLENEFTLIEIMEAFMVAAQYLIESSLNKPEVQEALKKSKPEVEAADEDEA